jgi:hypothetical protein
MMVRIGTSRVWHKSAQLEWRLGETVAARALLDKAIELHPQAAKLYMMRGQIDMHDNALDSAREWFLRGTTACPTSIPLWLLAARLEKADNKVRAGGWVFLQRYGFKLSLTLYDSRPRLAHFWKRHVCAIRTRLSYGLRPFVLSKHVAMTRSLC